MKSVFALCLLVLLSIGLSQQSSPLVNNAINTMRSGNYEIQDANVNVTNNPSSFTITFSGGAGTPIDSPVAIVHFM